MWKKDTKGKADKKTSALYEYLQSEAPAVVSKESRWCYGICALRIEMPAAVGMPE